MCFHKFLHMNDKMRIFNLYFHTDILPSSKFIKDAEGSRKVYADPFDIPTSINIAVDENHMIVKFLYCSDRRMEHISIGNTKIVYGAETFRIYEIQFYFDSTKEVFEKLSSIVNSDWLHACEKFNVLQKTEWNRMVINHLLNHYAHMVCASIDDEYELSIPLSTISGKILEIKSKDQYLLNIVKSKFAYKIPIIGTWLLGRAMRRLY